jgi:hypothetical protein
VLWSQLNNIKRALHLSPTAIPNAWRHVPTDKESDRGAQIDLLFDRDDDCIAVCEIKYGDAFCIDQRSCSKDTAESRRF